MGFDFRSWIQNFISYENIVFYIYFLGDMIMVYYVCIL